MDLLAPAKSLQRAFEADRESNLTRFVPLLLCSLLVLFVSYRIFLFAGYPALLIFIIGTTVAGVLLVMTTRNVVLAVFFWLPTVLGFRSAMVIVAPVLPDISGDRVMLVWAGGILLLNMLMGRTKLKAPYLPDFLICIHALYLWLAISITESGAINIWTRAYLMTLGAYFFGKYCLNEPKQIRRVFIMIYSLSFYHAFMSIAQHFHWNHLVWPKEILSADIGFAPQGRSRGVFLQPGVFGIYLGMTLMVQFYFLIRARKMVTKVLVAASLAFTAMGMFYTYTRGGWLASALGMLSLTYFGWRKYFIPVLVVCSLGSVVGISGMIGLQQDTFLQERLSNENTVEDRINLAATAIRMFRANPIFGVGFGNFREAQVDYREPINIPFFGLVKSQLVSKPPPHDIVLGTLAEEGVVGVSMTFMVYAFAISAFMKHFRRQRRGGEFENEILPVIGAIWVVYFAGGMTFDYRFFDSINVMFYLTAGMLIGIDTRDRSTGRLEMPQPGSLPRALPRRSP